MIKVLVVEDSPTVQAFLVHLLASDPAIQVIGTAGNGEEALEALRHSRPDVITMDIRMPKMDGLQATRRIMETRPIPIVIVSGNIDSGETTMTFQAMKAGALAVVHRPNGIGHPLHEATKGELIQTIKLMAEVKVVRRWPQSQPMATARLCPKAAPELRFAGIRLIAIGASTGGPPALQAILSGLPQDFPAPLLIVQHIAIGFLEGFVGWLNGSSRLSVHIAAHGERVRPGHAYVAPDDLQMAVNRDGTLVLSSAKPEKGHRPSVSFLFRSVADAFGINAVGVLLSGMGDDGAVELKLLKDKGAVTIAQDKDSAVVHGMPGVAIALGAATYILAPSRIAAVLSELVNKVNRP